MLARRTTLRHPLGIAIDMPRLVPSFSSKGFPVFKDGKTRKTYSETTRALETVGPFITDSMLVSAYDIHHGKLRNPSRFFGGKELVFIDSGGYELSAAYDSTEPVEPPHQVDDFAERDYRKVLRSLPKRVPFVIANYDWGSQGKTLEEQILAAQALFRLFPNFLGNFILKPTKRGAVLNIDDVIGHVRMLRGFDLVGVTEKELGRNLLDRLKNLGRIRAAMDREQVEAPIHVWGGLDPVITPLYFFVGAEVFDGVSWLRYAYHNGAAVYRDSFGVLELGVETPRDHVRGLTLNHNLLFLQRLTTCLRTFVDDDGRRFDAFDFNGEVFEKAYRTLCTKVPELKRGAR